MALQRAAKFTAKAATSRTAVRAYAATTDRGAVRASVIPRYSIASLPVYAPGEAASPRLRSTHGAASKNRTGLPDGLKSGIESLSGISLDNVDVHYNSPHPMKRDALAYAHGRDIYVAPQQERHLAHEAWHLVQQAQGRVKPTGRMADGVPINDDTALELEADVMGKKAAFAGSAAPSIAGPETREATASHPVQLKGKKQKLQGVKMSLADFHRAVDGNLLGPESICPRR